MIDERMTKDKLIELVGEVVGLREKLRRAGEELDRLVEGNGSGGASKGRPKSGDSIRARIYEVLAGEPGRAYTLPGLLRVMGDRDKRGSVANELVRMVKRKEIERVGMGRYRVAIKPPPSPIMVEEVVGNKGKDSQAEALEDRKAVQ